MRRMKLEKYFVQVDGEKMVRVPTWGYWSNVLWFIGHIPLLLRFGWEDRAGLRRTLFVDRCEHEMRLRHDEGTCGCHKHTKKPALDAVEVDKIMDEARGNTRLSPWNGEVGEA